MSKFDREFKVSAIKLVLESGNSINGTAVELGKSDSTQLDWKKKYIEDLKNDFLE